MRSEERRALVLLGITAVLAAFLATMYALVWAGTKKTEDFFFNFPCSGVPHLTVYDAPLLQGLITVWVVYAILMFFYFSPDWFRGKGGASFRDLFHYAGTVVMGFYPIYILWSIPVYYILIVWVPAWLQLPYVLVMVGAFIYFEVRFVEFAVDDRGLFKRYALRVYLSLKPPFARAITSKLTRYRVRIPPRLRKKLIRLKGSIRNLTRRQKARRVFKPTRQQRLVLILAFVIILEILIAAYWNYCGPGFFR